MDVGGPNPDHHSSRSLASLGRSAIVDARDSVGLVADGNRIDLKFIVQDAATFGACASFHLSGRMIVDAMDSASRWRQIWQSSAHSPTANGTKTTSLFKRPPEMIAGGGQIASSPDDAGIAR